MTPWERAYAIDIFADSIDYEAVQISQGSAWATFSATAIGNVINLRPCHFAGDTLELSEAGRSVLIHELGHVWQYQNGGIRYVTSSLIAQISAWLRTGSRRSAYDWRRAQSGGLPWHAWNAEQQAQCIADYSEAIRRMASGRAAGEDRETILRALPCIRQVRRRIGAPGGRPEEGAGLIFAKMPCESWRRDGLNEAEVHDHGAADR